MDIEFQSITYDEDELEVPILVKAELYHGQFDLAVHSIQAYLADDQGRPGGELPLAPGSSLWWRLLDEATDHARAERIAGLEFQADLKNDR